MRSNRLEVRKATEGIATSRPSPAPRPGWRTRSPKGHRRHSDNPSPVRAVPSSPSFLEVRKATEGIATPPLEAEVVQSLSSKSERPPKALRLLSPAEAGALCSYSKSERPPKALRLLVGKVVLSGAHSPRSPKGHRRHCDSQRSWAVVSGGVGSSKSERPPKALRLFAGWVPAPGGSGVASKSGRPPKALRPPSLGQGTEKGRFRRQVWS